MSSQCCSAVADLIPSVALIFKGRGGGKPTFLGMSKIACPAHPHLVLQLRTATPRALLEGSFSGCACSLLKD